MMNKEVFEIKLEDYRFPRYASTVRSYYGTMDNIINLMVHLSDNDWTRTRYQETIDAAEFYDLDNEITHTVAGQAFPILTPVEEVARFETQLTNRSWYYTAYNGAVYPCWAEKIDVCQTLIRTGDGYQRCLRASISGLNICHHGTSWTTPGNAIKGFPGVVTWDSTGHTMNLAVALAHYPFEEQNQAFADVVDIETIDLSVVVADILAEG